MVLAVYLPGNTREETDIMIRYFVWVHCGLLEWDVVVEVVERSAAA